MKNFTVKTFLSIVLIIVSVIFILSHLVPEKYASGFDVTKFSKIPVQEGGRIKPLDTVARNKLMMMRGKQTVRLPKNIELSTKAQKLSAIVWLMDVVMRPEVANTFKVFRIDNAEVLGLFGWQQETKGKYFSFDDLTPHLDEIFKQAAHINPDKELRTVFEDQLEKLHQSLLAYNRLMASFSSAGHPDMLEQEYAAWSANIALGMEAIRAKEAGKEYDAEILGRFASMADRYLQLAKLIEIGTVPPIFEEVKINELLEFEDWANIGQALLDIIVTQQFPEIVIDYAKLTVAYRQMDEKAFNSTLTKMHEALDPAVNMTKINFEVFFNQLEPFYISSTLYILVFLAICISWLWGGDEFRKPAFIFLALAFLAHTFGLIGRMYIQGRPPVTNLYSSAIFIGWACVVIAMIMEWIHKNGIPTAVAGIIGFSTLIIAHNLGIGEDTLEMMRAVLDSNFWLSTHVVVITMGYSAMFLMGIIAIFYVLGGLKKGGLTPEIKRSLSSMVFGTLCFATLFSFVGTMLGGIWADQSWGRFWGWDPKENGALLIVLWCAIMLHARWGKLVQDRGLMVMAIFGNIVTSWSWFGTNMLGVGLHSYGFMDRAFLVLMVFILTQFAIMGIGIFVKKKHK